MNPFSKSCAFAAVLVATAPMAGPSQAQSAKDIVGTWTLVGVTLEQGDKKLQPFGAAPKGLSIITPTHIAVGISRSGLPKFGSNDRMTGTADENKAAMQGNISFFGTWTFSEADKAMIITITGSNYPNWEGAEQKRTITFDGDTMTFANPTPSAGGPGGVAKIVWKRVN